MCVELVSNRLSLSIVAWLCGGDMSLAVLLRACLHASAAWGSSLLSGAEPTHFGDYSLRRQIT